MSKEKVIIDFGSSYVAVYSKFLRLREPSRVIISRGKGGGLVAFGENAKKTKKSVNPEEQYILPIVEGVLVHFEGGKLMMLGFLRKAGISPLNELIVLVSQSLNSEQRRVIEKLFVEIGYKDVVIKDNLSGLSPFVEPTGEVVAVIGGSLTEAGVVNKDGIVSAYTLNVGGNTVNERIRAVILDKYSLIISNSSAERLKKRVGSLYPNENSKAWVFGNDVIDDSMRKAEVSSRDIYEAVLFCYSKILRLIEGIISEADTEIVKTVGKKGVLICGGGAEIQGLELVAKEIIGIRARITEPITLHLKGNERN